MANNPSSSTKSPCVACIFTHRKCPRYCRDGDIFRNVISYPYYKLTFTVFGVKSTSNILCSILEDRYPVTPHSLLYEAKARIEDPVGGCVAHMASFEQKLEVLQSRVMALEARLNEGSTSANPSSSFAPFGGYLNLLMLVSLPRESSSRVFPA